MAKYKRIVIGIFIVVLLIALTYIGKTYAVVIGDVNNDGKTNSLDYVLVRKHIMKLSTLKSDEIKRADINQDNNITSADYILIRKIIMGASITTPTPTKTPTPTQSPTPTPTPPPPTPTPTPLVSKVYFLKTGDADSIIIQSGNHFGLIDAAVSGDFANAKLAQLGAKSLDFIIATHPHNDHIGGMAKVVDAYADANTTYYYRNPTGYGSIEGNEIYNKTNNILNILKSKGSKIVEVTNQYPKFTLGDFSFELMNTESAYADEKNASGIIAGANKDSIVAYALYKGSIGTLFTGDLESQDEYRIIPKLAGKPVDVLKVAHHSWQSSTTMKFTKAVKPKIAIVTADHLLDDISTPVYYMQQVYGTKFYVTGKSDDGITIDYSNNLTVSPAKALKSNYSIIKTTGNWRQLQNGIWFYLDNPNDINSIVETDWRLDGGKWYYMGIQGNMMTGWIEVNYKGTPGLYYLDTSGAMFTGWQRAKSYSPYGGNDPNYGTWMYSEINYTVNAWYQYSSTWANGKNWFYFDSSGRMVTGRQQINGKWYTFNDSGVCTAGC